MSQNLASSLGELTARERIYVKSRLDGLTQQASCAAAGIKPDNPSRMENNGRVQRAMMTAMSQIAEEIGFSRKEAHEMLMGAYSNAATAAEQIQAVKEMINLHGLAAPKQVEHKHEYTGTVNLERMETQALLKLAGMENLLLEGECEEVDDAKKLPEL